MKKRTSSSTTSTSTIAAPGDVDAVKKGEFLPKSASASAKTFGEGEGEEEWVEADVVIAGDGVRSVARRDMLKVHGEEDHSTL